MRSVNIFVALGLISLYGFLLCRSYAYKSNLPILFFLKGG